MPLGRPAREPRAQIVVFDHRGYQEKVNDLTNQEKAAGQKPEKSGPRAAGIETVYPPQSDEDEAPEQVSNRRRAHGVPAQLQSASTTYYLRVMRTEEIPACCREKEWISRRGVGRSGAGY